MISVDGLDSLAQRLKRVTQTAMRRAGSLEFPHRKIAMDDRVEAVLNGYQAKLDLISQNGGLLKIVTAGVYCKKIESFYPPPSLEEEAVIVSLAQQGDENASAILLGIFLPLVYRVTLSFASRRKGSRSCNFYEDFEDFFGNCLDTLMNVVYQDIVFLEAERPSEVEAFVVSRLKNGLYSYLRQKRQRVIF